MLHDYGVISDDDAAYDIPPGEEAFDLSHEGGEHEAFAGLAQDVEGLCGRYAYVVLTCSLSNPICTQPIR